MSKSASFALPPREWSVRGMLVWTSLDRSLQTSDLSPNLICMNVFGSKAIQDIFSSLDEFNGQSFLGTGAMSRVPRPRNFYHCSSQADHVSTSMSLADVWCLQIRIFEELSLSPRLNQPDRRIGYARVASGWDSPPALAKRMNCMRAAPLISLSHEG